MKTIVISIDDFEKTVNGYPVSIFSDEGDNPNWQKEPLCKSLIPQDVNIAASTERENKVSFTIEEMKAAMKNNTSASLPKKMEIGEYLYQLLFRGNLMVEWDKLQAKYPGNGAHKENLRTILEIKPEELSLIPWELLFHEHKWLFLDISNPFMRGSNLDFNKEKEETLLNWPIRVLVVVGSKPDDEEAKADEEIASLKKIFLKRDNLIDWELLEFPSHSELLKVYQEMKPHIFHFIGHGESGENGEPILRVFSKKDDGSWDWKITDIISQFSGLSPYFAFINACHSSEMTLKHPFISKALKEFCRLMVNYFDS